jgi:predicted lysophospholipase L1 biosynthesis ABC-type transport system permease subunit
VTGSREPATYQIVGVAGDANYLEIREAERRALYVPAFRQGRVIAHTFVLRTAVRPESVADDFRRAVRAAAPSIQVRRAISLNDQIDASIVPERLLALLSGFFAALGALLAGAGVYGLLAYTVARRTNEIGVRMALGATPARVSRMILRESLAIAAIGLLFGIPVALWGRAIAAAILPAAAPGPAAPLAWGAAAILLVALLASSMPARRAARVDPMQSLRQE